MQVYTSSIIHYQCFSWKIDRSINWKWCWRNL